MNSFLSPCNHADVAASLSAELSQAHGVAAFGVARAEPVSESERQIYRKFIASGRHGSMDYLARNEAVRTDPRMLLDGAQSLVVCAFPYFPHTLRQSGLPHMAVYAFGRDYHEVIRRELTAAAGALAVRWGGEWRVCVDTAPLRERYWAVKAGVGFIGRNQQIIVPGVGSYVFLGTLITTLRLPVSTPSKGSCLDCGACVKACPGQALHPDGTLDARRCLSYLTIEHKGDFPPDTDLHGCLYGCDRCQQVCPHNIALMPTLLPDFEPSAEVLRLDAAAAASMTQDEFSVMFRGSAVKRVKLRGLQRNARALINSMINLDEKKI